MNILKKTKILISVFAFSAFAQNVFCDIVKDFKNIETQYEKLLKKDSSLSEKYLADETCRFFKEEIDKCDRKKFFAEKESTIRNALNETHSNGFTPLFYAIKNQDTVLIRRMLFYGADCNISTNKKGFSNIKPIHLACLTDNSEIINLILERTMDINASGTFPEGLKGNPISILGTKTDAYNYFDIIELLLRKGGNPNSEITKENLTLSVLQYLSNFYSKKNLPVIKLLLENKADFITSFKIGSETKSILLCSAISGDKDFSDSVLEQMENSNQLSKLDEKIEIQIPTDSTYIEENVNIYLTGTVLGYLTATFNTNPENYEKWNLLKKLHEKGSDINRIQFIGNDELSPLMIFSMKSSKKNDYSEKIMELLEIGGDPNENCRIADWKLTPFNYISKNADRFNSDIFTIFRNAGGDIYKKDSENKNSFDYMAIHQKNSADRIEFSYLLTGKADFENFTDLNFQEKTSTAGLSILQVVIKNGDEENALKILKENLVDWKYTDSMGKNSFDYAITKDCSKIIKFFLDNNIPIGKSLFTLIDKTLENGNLDIFMKFLRANDFSTVTGKLPISENISNEETGPVIYAALKNLEGKNAKNREMVVSTLLLRGEKISDAGLNKKFLLGGRTPLHYLLEKNDETTAIQLLEYKANLEIADNSGNTPKDIAFRKNQVQVINWMLNRKIPLGNGIFAAIDSELDGHDSFIQEFLKFEGKSQSQFSFKETKGNQLTVYGPITYTAMKNSENQIKVLKKLFESGFDVNEKISGGEENGETALLISAKNGNAELFKFLLENNGDLSAENNGSTPGKTAIFYSLEFKNHQITEQILNSREFKIRDIQLKNQTTLLMYFAKFGTFEEMNSAISKIVFENQFALERKDSSGKTPFLYAAAFNEDYRIMELLRMYGANVNATDKNGNNGKTIAIQNGNNESVVKRLENYGVY